MAILSTDFQNEIINETINTKRKYFMTDNDDGTVSFTDNTSYTQAGTEYGAEEIIEEREQINQHTNVIGSDEFNPESSYSAGDYFIYNNKLCKALSAISAGAALSLGSNYQVTSIKNELSGLNGKSRYQGTYSGTYANGGTFEVFKNNGLAIFPINVNLHDISEEWVNIADLASAEIYPYVGTFLYSIPVRGTSGVFQIMLDAGDRYIKARYSGDVISSLVIQDTLVWVTN